MIRFFKQKVSKLKNNCEYDLLYAIIVALPEKYSFLKEQINPNHLIKCVPNDLLEEGWKRVIYDNEFYKKYKKTNANYKLVGIKVYDIKIQSYKNVEFDLFEGMLLGYKIENNSLQYDYRRIDLSDLREYHYNNTIKKELLDIIGTSDEKILSMLDIESSFIIEISDNLYYIIKNFEDGNYIALNSCGSVFSLIHDPFSIEVLYDRIEDFLMELKSNKFDINDFYNSNF